MDMSDHVFPIDVVSDVVCPWCYLGKRHLEIALEQLGDASIEVTWRPFQLDPTTPSEGVDRKTYFERKFGSLEAVAPAHARLVEMGRKVGIEYRFDDIKRTPNTLDAHRVIRWANEAGLGNAMVDRLFRAFFTEARDIGDREILADLAAEIGLDRSIVAARLAANDDRSAVQDEIEEAQRMGVTGVPCIIVNHRYAVMGAQPPAAIIEAIRQAREEADARSRPLS
jgi:predicted DsbA family dithiol-disulfide isomerase